MGKKGLGSLVRRPANWPLFRARGAGTIRSRLLAAFGLIVLLVAVVIITTSVVEGVQSGRQRVINQLQSVVTLKEAEINTWVQALQSDLLVALNGETHIQQASALLQQSAADRDRQAGRENLRGYLKSLIENTRRFDELFLLDAEGNVVLSTEVRQEGKVFQQEDYYQCGLEEPCVQPPSYSSSLGQMVVMLARPVVDGSGETIGVMAGRASMAVLNGVMQERVGLGDTGETYLVGKNYAMLTASHFDETDVYARTDGVNAAIKEHINGSGIYPNYRGAPVVGVYRWLPDLQVALLAEQSRQATAQVKAILSDIQHATNATVMATEEGTKGVEVGVQLASQTEAVIGQLSSVIDESAQAAMQMVAGGQQQASGMEQIALAMNSISQATVQSLASTRQAEQASQNLNDLARNLNKIVEGYKV